MIVIAIQTTPDETVGYLCEEGLSSHIKYVNFDVAVTTLDFGHTKVDPECGHIFGDKSLLTETLYQTALYENQNK